MFEVIEDTTATEQQHAVAQHVQAIFSKAKALKSNMDDLREQEKQRRIGTRFEKTTLDDFSVAGLKDTKQSYSDNMAELDSDGVIISELYVSAIQAQAEEVRGRFEGIGQHRQNLHAKLAELVEAEAALNQQSGDYSALIAQGDINGADAMERERLNQLQETNAAKQDTEYKLAAAVRAESILERELGIYREMYIKAHRNLIMQNYEKVLLPRFTEQLSGFAETLKEMNRTIGRMATKKPEEWEHWVKLKEVLHNSGRHFIQDSGLKEQQFYQGIV